MANILFPSCYGAASLEVRKTCIVIQVESVDRLGHKNELTLSRFHGHLGHTYQERVELATIDMRDMLF